MVLSLNNIGCIFDDQDKFEEALYWYQCSLEMKEKCFPSGHVEIARNLINIDSILYQGRVEVSNWKNKSIIPGIYLIHNNMNRCL